MAAGKSQKLFLQGTARVTRWCLPTGKQLLTDAAFYYELTYSGLVELGFPSKIVKLP